CRNTPTADGLSPVGRRSVEAPAGIEPANSGFADRCLTTWLRRPDRGKLGHHPPVLKVRPPPQSLYGPRRHLMPRGSKACGTEPLRADVLPRSTTSHHLITAS